MMLLRATGIGVAILAAACAPSADEVSQADLGIARQASAELASTLRSRLVETISAEGPLAAIDVCSRDAPLIAEEISRRRGLIVGRTALKTRNPDNAPDDWEREQITKFIDAAARGQDIADLESAAVVSRADGKYLRWMRPIVMEGPCVICHGEAIAPELKAAISDRYPGDEAIGFREGAVRGAFTVTKRLSE